MLSGQSVHRRKNTDKKKINKKKLVGTLLYVLTYKRLKTCWLLLRIIARQQRIDALRKRKRQSRKGSKPYGPQPCTSTD